MKGILVLGLGLAALTAGCSSPAGGGGGGLTVAECRSYYEHIHRLDGLDVAKAMGEEALARDAATCSEYGSVSRKHFTCAMSATSVDALQACGPSNS
ncbi:hypothetical protein [Arenimonas terrae]|uniref:Lipoprotein n=1 Tax=Arenimonas terrae TaxID=2546226 RepID=A0A5C4RRB6_9GAMM|nr:hypothetical protein [Arenimonas terrae]TNJ33361.1 hypothetical protein E1B00_13810 [Arenimonas terrae]